MLVHKGGKIRNWGGECRDVTPTILQSQNIFKESTGGGGGGVGLGGQDGCERRIKVFVKNQKIYNFFFYFFFWGGVGGRVGGGGSGWGGQGRCEQRSEVFVKIKKKNCGGSVRGGGGGGSGWGEGSGWM